MIPEDVREAATKGFTLLEMLVVFVITGLMSAVLMQGFGAILTTRLSVANAISNLQDVILSQNIMIDPLRGVLADYENSPYVFRGQERTLSGETLRPLLSPQGAPTPFKMTLDYDVNANTTTLNYEEPGRPAVALRQWAGNVPTFKYRDIRGPWGAVWPPPMTGTSQTPWLIWIDTGAALAPLVASVGGSHKKVPRLDELIPGASSADFSK